jgi:hypothetical protein
MSIIISYRNPARPDEAGITLIADKETRELTNGTGEFIPAPIGIPDLLDTLRAAPVLTQVRPGA